MPTKQKTFLVQSISAKRIKRFVEVWQASNRRSEVTKKMAMSIGKVQNLSTKLRLAGVPLKKLVAGPRLTAINVNELVTLAKKSNN